jgi:prepilin-type N-terminal cleavage/methylation domain-containing protein
MDSSNRAFTIIELLVVIAIIAILAVTVILVLNPSQLLAQSRDTQRLADLATINSAVGLYNTDQGGSLGYSLGSASTAYLSLPSPSSSCATLNLATSAYGYNCSTNANYRLASSNGWLPINFNLISAGSPFGSVPVDPTNQTSSGLYYSYTTNGSVYEVSALAESQKYAKAGFQGTNDPALLEEGSGVSNLPDAGRGLVGYWPLNEGQGSSTLDWSGDGDVGTWTGTPTGTNGTYYTPGHIWQWAGDFDGATDYVTIQTSTNVEFGSGDFTVAGWYYLNSLPGVATPLVGTSDVGPRWDFELNSNKPTCRIESSAFYYDQTFSFYGTSPVGQWVFFACVYARAAGTLYGYLNGTQYSTGYSMGNNLGSVSTSSSFLYLGSTESFPYFKGYLSDIRLYDRALSASEITTIYNAEK